MSGFVLDRCHERLVSFFALRWLLLCCIYHFSLCSSGLGVRVLLEVRSLAFVVIPSELCLITDEKYLRYSRRLLLCA